MRIVCHTRFLDGTDEFHKDDARTVDDARGQKFIAYGWASEVGATRAQPDVKASAETVLDIQDANLLTAGE